MRLPIYSAGAIIALALLAQCNAGKKSDIELIPMHKYFIKEKIRWQPDPYDDSSYMKAAGQKEVDTMIIATPDKLILISGQYGLKPGDTIIMPYSGEFGIRYEVISDGGHKSIEKSSIHINGQSFVAARKVKFEWWLEILPKINKPGKGKIIVSGP